MAGSCQIDFYLLGSPTLEAPRLACKLALMAWERGHTIAVVTDSDSAAALDELMWDYPEGRFLPHECGTAAGDSPAPIIILDSVPQTDADVVINLTAQPLPEPQLFNRLLEIVPHRPAERQASREKFKAYRALGFEPSAHEIN